MIHLASEQIGLKNKDMSTLSPPYTIGDHSIDHRGVLFILNTSTFKVLGLA